MANTIKENKNKKEKDQIKTEVIVKWRQIADSKKQEYLVYMGFFHISEIAINGWKMPLW